MVQQTVAEGGDKPDDNRTEFHFCGIEFYYAG